MCGIAGYIGRSTNPELSYQLITALFDQIEIRGKDAAGVYATEHGRKGAVIYHKEPGPSSKFIKTDFWEDVANYDIDMMLCHARGTSPGIGGAATNTNNHPFVSKDLNYGLIHNGRIHEYDKLKSKYETETDCDSEILLRMIQSPDNREFKLANGEIPERYQGVFNGFCDIWSQIDYGHFAITLGQRWENGDRTLYLCRNRHRPIWLADLRKELGQIFFCSTDLIFTYVCSDIDELADVGIPLVELPPQHVWILNISENSNWRVKEDEIFRSSFKTTYNSQWAYEGKAKPIIVAEPEAALITNLDDKGFVNRPIANVTTAGERGVVRNIGFQSTVSNVKQETCLTSCNQTTTRQQNLIPDADCSNTSQVKTASQAVEYDDDDDEDTVTIPYDGKEYESAFGYDRDYDWDAGDVQVSATDITLACSELIELVEKITANAENSVSEQSMSKRDHEELLTVLDGVRSDLQSALAQLRN